MVDWDKLQISLQQAACLGLSRLLVDLDKVLDLVGRVSSQTKLYSKIEVVKKPNMPVAY